MTTSKAMCGAMGRSGKPCTLSAGWGTDHPGYGNCKHHLGSTTNGRKSAAKAAAVPELSKLVGYEVVDADPFEALLRCVRITNAEVTFYSERIAQLEMEQVTGRPMREDLDRDGMVHDLAQPVALNIWVELRTKAVERLAKFAKMAIDAGVAERQVRLAEQWGEGIARFIREVLGELQLTTAQKKQAPDVVRRHLILLEGGGV